MRRLQASVSHDYMTEISNQFIFVHIHAPHFSYSEYPVVIVASLAVARFAASSSSNAGLLMFYAWNCELDNENENENGNGIRKGIRGGASGERS